MKGHRYMNVSILGRKPGPRRTSSAIVTAAAARSVVQEQPEDPMRRVAIRLARFARRS